MAIDPYNSDQQALITQLQQQQALFTQALKAAVEGVWQGAGSVEALLYALDPNMQGTLSIDTPVVHSEYEPPKAD